MNELVNFIRLKRDSEGAQLAELEALSKVHFKSLDILCSGDWDDDEWSYLKVSDKLKFKSIGGGTLPIELSTLSKIFIVEVLWNQRLRGEPYSHSYIADLLNPFKVWAEMGIQELSELNQDSYDATIIYLRDRYTVSEPYGIKVNKVIKFLNDKNILNAHIDTHNIRKVLGNTDEYGKVLAKKNKMPLPELVKAIIHLKWAVDDSFDGSTKSVNDKLCILTQVFQYGLGLRLGETLRLPIDPLIEVNGEMFCLVWTEKGHIPMARYVPSIWRHPLSEAVAEIRKITQPYRDVAIQIEQRNNLCFVDERLDCLHQEKAALLAHKIDELKVLLELKKQDSVKLWQLKREVKPTERYELKDLNEVLPIASNAKDSSSLITYYRQMGIDIVSESLGGRKHKHYVTGKDIVNVIDELVAKRASNVTLKELLTIINPQRSDILNSSKDKLIKENIDKLYGAANYLTFTFGDEKYSVNGTCIGVVSFENAIKILESYVLGGYDNNRFVSISDFNDMFPELFNITSSSKNNIENILVNKKECFYVKHGGERGFQKVRGYLVDIDKLKNYLISEYIRINVGIESDLLDASIEEYLEDGVEITSKSFRIKQKPSDYLFIRAGMRGGNYFDYLPQILGYNAVNYFFKGNEIQEDAFTRYDISVELHVIESWQSHKGRHWQTTSLFRAGLAELVVNKWMGRTSGQGENYDHNTGRERAKVIGKAMLENTERFLGYVPDKIRKWKEQEIPIETMPDHLNDNLKSVQYSPLGYCLRDLYLKPCEFNLRCLTGNEGKGCKHYIYDLYDPSHRERVTAERDKSSLELSRLLEVYDRGIEAAAMHIEHHMTILRNTTSILEDAELILRDQQLEELQDFMPFKINGSYPDDCPFQCGDSE